jgi:hypothetical protein
MKRINHAAHRVDRGLGFFSSRPNWEPPPPHPQASAPPPLVPGGTLACEREGGGSQFGRGDRHCGTLGIYVLCNTANKELVIKG